MSLTTIHQAANDPALLDRVVSGVWKETIGNPEFGNSPYGQQVIRGTAPIVMTFAFPVAVDTEAAYESAIIAGNQNPGGDPSVITDAAIGSAIQAHWPDETAPLP